MTNLVPPAKTLVKPRREPKLRPDIQLPELPAHHHTDSCDCEPTQPYLRVSAAGGRTKIVSPVVQFEGILLDSKLNKRRLVGPILFDLKSGKTVQDRIAPVLEIIRSGKAKNIAVYKWDRWGRNLLESLQMCAAVQDAGGEIYSATEAFDTKNPTADLVRHILLAVAEHQGKMISQSWRNIQAYRRENGLPHSGRDRFGYVYQDQKYLIYEPEATALRNAYTAYVAGTSLRQIARDWNEAGHVTSMGGRWTPQAVGKMLDTGFAAGYIRERSTPGTRPANTLANYDVWREGSHAAIITDDLWHSYRGKRAALSELPPRLHRPAHELSGLIFCFLCGRRMTTKYMGQKATHHWVCTHRAAYHPDTAIGISNKIALEVVLDWVQKRGAAGDADATARGQMVTEAARASEPNEASVEAERLLSEINKVKRKLNRLRDLYLEEDADITKAEYDGRRSRYNGERRALEAELSKVRAAGEQPVSIEARIPAFRSLAEHWPELAPELRNRALAALIGMVRISPTAQPRLTSQSWRRVEIVPSWEMAVWGDAWLSERRRWQASL